MEILLMIIGLPVAVFLCIVTVCFTGIVRR